MEVTGDLTSDPTLGPKLTFHVLCAVAVYVCSIATASNGGAWDNAAPVVAQSSHFDPNISDSRIPLRTLQNRDAVTDVAFLFLSDRFSSALPSWQWQPSPILPPVSPGIRCNVRGAVGRCGASPSCSVSIQCI
jgi:hypothetical protein